MPPPAVQDSDIDGKSWSNFTQPLRGAQSAKWLKSALHSASWVDVLDHKRSAALERWKVLVLFSGEATSLGRAILAAQKAEDPSAVDVSISDASHRKATSTLRTRAASLMMLCRWRAAESGVAICWSLPLDEQTVYDYVVHHRRTKAPRSRAPRFLEALGFRKGVLGADVQVILDSSRVRGAGKGTSDV